jgi:hypothetical protein
VKNKYAEFTTREDRARLTKQVKLLVDKYKSLNNYLTVLNMPKDQLKKLVGNYIFNLETIMTSFYNGRGVAKILDEAEIDFQLSLKKYVKNVKPVSVKQSVKSNYLKSILNVIDHIKKDTGKKFDEFISKAMESGIKEKDIERTKNPEITIDGKSYNILTDADRKILNSNPHAQVKMYNETELKQIWDTVTEKRGDVGTIVYRNGSVYPLHAWAEMRTRTDSQDIHRLESMTAARENHIYTGIISDHGARDSCGLWEDKIIFYGEQEKMSYLAEFPGDTFAKKIPTVEDLKKDPTHIFKHNCTHTLSPRPVQYMSDADRQQEMNYRLPDTSIDNVKRLDKEARAA